MSKITNTLNRKMIIKRASKNYTMLSWKAAYFYSTKHKNKISQPTSINSGDVYSNKTY